MANTTNPRRNAEGYSDPIAYEALKNIEREEDERFHRLLHTLFYLCELADFEIEVGLFWLINGTDGFGDERNESVILENCVNFSPLLFGGFGRKPTFEKIFERVRTIFLKKAQKKWAKARF